MTVLPTARDIAELVRLPAALTVPGDALAGAAADGWGLGRRAPAMPLASVALYWAGMALNDYADRDLDRVERPERPLPSGRVTPSQALGLAGALTAAGVAIAGFVGGRRSMGVALPLAAVVWSYDLALKNTPVGPAAMAAARGLDVLLGSAGRLRGAAVPAAAIALHTAGVTVLSRGEVHGSKAKVAAAVTAGTVLNAAAVAAVPGPADRRARVGAIALAGVFAATVGRAQAAAVSKPDSATVRSATGEGIRGMIPLQAALAARSGALRTASALLAAGPVARLASKAVSPT
jgi:4-hydroxybenzoate polyprenyltransferase